MLLEAVLYMVECVLFYLKPVSILSAYFDNKIHRVVVLSRTYDTSHALCGVYTRQFSNNLGAMKVEVELIVKISLDFHLNCPQIA